MQKLKRFLLYVLLVVVLSLAVCAVFRGFVSDCLTSAFDGVQRVSYYRAAVNAAGDVAALGVRDGKTVLTTGSRDGSRTDRDIMPELPGIDDYRADGLFACRSGYMLTLYTCDADGRISGFALCYLPADGGDPLLLAKRACEDRNDVRVSAFYEDNGVVSFALWQNGICESFNYRIGETGISATDNYAADAFSSAAVLRDGTVLMYTPDGYMASSDGTEATELSDAAPVNMWASDVPGCVYMLDGVSGGVMLYDTAAQSLTEVLAGCTDTAVDVYVSQTGTAVVLTEDGSLLYCESGATTDVGSALYRSRWVSVVILAVLLIAVLFAAYALWYALCEVRKLKISLVLRKGALLLVILALGVACALELWGEAYFDSLAARQAQSALRTAAALVRGGGPDDSGTLAGVAADLAGADGAYGETTLYVFRRDNGRFAAVAASEGYSAGVDSDSLLLGSDFTAALAAALDSGEASVSFMKNGSIHYVCALRSGTSMCVAAVMDGRQLARQYADSFRLLEYAVWAAAAVLFVIVLLMLLQTRRGLKRVTKGVDTICAGNTNVEVVERGGDELEGLADSFNTLARNLRTAAGGSSRRGESYMRFVPQQIITLLGAGSVEDVDKHTFASRYMATMSVHFLFDEKVYESRSRELFDNINEVIERTAGIIPQNGGTVYDFSHDGYDALFEADTDAAVSAAVAIRQEVIALNRDRSKDGASPVQLHIALDVGDVMMGVVGDEIRMEATAISSSFNTTRMLSSLFSRFEANILCTEGIVGHADNYGSRYIGKTRDGNEMIRVYEIFDGDAYSTRVGKSATAREFSDGVYTLYSRDFTAAKRIFMDIARKNGSDGVARFYLYLADRFEKEGPDEISLDY